MTFWALLHQALTMTGTCRVLTESTHSTPWTRNVVLYGGSCIAALLLVFQIPGTAWVSG
jgi:hypothetical protein